MAFRFSRFTRNDFPEYQSWYKDAELHLRLGPMGEEWLEHVMKETNECEYSVFNQNQLVAVIGIIFPDVEHPDFYLTDFAIKPNLRNKGLGTEILQELLRLHPLENGQSWRTYIDVKNTGAKRFFERNGWTCFSESPDEHDMMLYVLS